MKLLKIVARTLIGLVVYCVFVVMLAAPLAGFASSETKEPYLPMFMGAVVLLGSGALCFLLLYYVSPPLFARMCNFAFDGEWKDGD